MVIKKMTEQIGETGVTIIVKEKTDKTMNATGDEGMVGEMMILSVSTAFNITEEARVTRSILL